MATKLNSSVTRESYATVRESGQDRQIIITIEPPSLLKFRAKGCRRSYALTANACYMLAVKAHVEHERNEKRKAKKSKAKVGRKIHRRP